MRKRRDKEKRKKIVLLAEVPSANVYELCVAPHKDESSDHFSCPHWLSRLRLAFFKPRSLLAMDRIWWAGLDTGTVAWPNLPVGLPFDHGIVQLKHMEIELCLKFGART